YEVTTHFTLARHYDRAARRLIDPTAQLPGDNGYARVYDPDALRRRVLDHIDRSAFDVALVQLRIGGKPVPDRTLPRNRKYTAINCPFRALLITRKA
ncbi:MAG TPA: hypothetical protein VF832_11160, partial [Longimicrobiales bacterium]